MKVRTLDGMKLRKYDYIFMGWGFYNHTWYDKDYKREMGCLTCYWELENPEGNAVCSYHNYGGPYFTKEMAAAWLIAHWFEHKLITCPCQHGDGKTPISFGGMGLSKLGRAIMDSLLFYREKLGEGPTCPVELVYEPF